MAKAKRSPAQKAATDRMLAAAAARRAAGGGHSKRKKSSKGKRKSSKGKLGKGTMAQRLKTVETAVRTVAGAVVHLNQRVTRCEKTIHGVLSSGMQRGAKQLGAG